MRTLVRRFGSPLAAVGTGLLMVLTLAPGNAVARGNVTTPGNFTGYGFDQCLAPEQWRDGPLAQQLSLPRGRHLHLR